MGAFLYVQFTLKGGENMARKAADYKIPSQSQGKVNATNLIKDQKTPKKTTGGDLRSK